MKMFTFTEDVPHNIRAFLIPLVQAWIDRRDAQIYRFETMRYGMVSFIRTPWPPPSPDQASVVGPAGEVDLAAMEAFASTF